MEPIFEPALLEMPLAKLHQDVVVVVLMMVSLLVVEVVVVEIWVARYV